MLSRSNAMRHLLFASRRNWIGPAGFLLTVVVGASTWKLWLPAAQSLAKDSIAWFRTDKADDGVESDRGHGHTGNDHASRVLRLSETAMKNLGLSTDAVRPVHREVFRRSITVPAVIVERPGRTRLPVATPMNGVVTHVHALQDEAVEPDDLLFEIRLTHEDLVQLQTEYLRNLGELDVEEVEVERLKEPTRSGAISGQFLREAEYLRDKLNAILRAQREALRLHGLSEDQVRRIARERRLLQRLQLAAPSTDDHPESELRLTGERVHNVSQSFRRSNENPSGQTSSVPLIIQLLSVHKGQFVTAGETLCVLKDYGELLIEGHAFEQDVPLVRNALKRGWNLSGVLEGAHLERREVNDLKIGFISSEIDQDARTLHFYVRLTNEVISDSSSDDGRFVQWKFLPGQRLQLRVPVEEWLDQIVVPVEAVARDGAESFVFMKHGQHFDRTAIHEKYRDQFSVVIDRNGRLRDGDTIAWKGAHQMHMAMSNRERPAGASTHAHHGHSH